jgi:hypothetical protein
VVKEINQHQSKRCFKCGEHGYWAKDYNKPPKKTNKIKGTEIKEIVNSIHGEQDEGNMSKELANMFEVVAFEVDEPNSWYIDSRTSKHVIGNIGSLKKLK